MSNHEKNCIIIFIIIITYSLLFFLLKHYLLSILSIISRLICCIFLYIIVFSVNTLSHYFCICLCLWETFSLMHRWSARHRCTAAIYRRSGALRQRASPWQPARSQLCAINEPAITILYIESAALVTKCTPVWFHLATHVILFNSTGSPNYLKMSVKSTVFIPEVSLWTSSWKLVPSLMFSFYF